MRGRAGTNTPDRVLAALQDGPATAADLAERLDAQLGTVYKAVQRLTRSGKIQVIDIDDRPRTAGHWPYLHGLAPVRPR